MAKWVLSIVAGFLGVCLPLSAQQIGRSDVFGALYNPINLPSLALAGGQLFSFACAVGTTPPEFLPANLPTVGSGRANAAYSATSGKDSSKEVSDVRHSNLLDYVHGEVGFMYGHSTGKFKTDVESGYVISEIGDDKFNVTVGAFYENSNTHFSRQIH